MSERKVGDFEKAFSSMGRALDNFMPAFKRIVETLTSELNKEEDLQDYQIRRWLSQVPHGGMVGEKAVLIVYNEKHPSASYILVEDIKI